MAIYRLLKNSTLEPEEIGRITEAYQQALDTLCVKDRDDPLTEMIAKQIIKIAQAGGPRCPSIGSSGAIVGTGAGRCG
jgi:hypothetical protein